MHNAIEHGHLGVMKVLLKDYHGNPNVKDAVCTCAITSMGHTFALTLSIHATCFCFRLNVVRPILASVSFTGAIPLLHGL